MQPSIFLGTLLFAVSWGYQEGNDVELQKRLFLNERFTPQNSIRKNLFPRVFEEDDDLARDVDETELWDRVLQQKDEIQEEKKETFAERMKRVLEGFNDKRSQFNDQELYQEDRPSQRSDSTLANLNKRAWLILEQLHKLKILSDDQIISIALSTSVASKLPADAQKEENVPMSESEYEAKLHMADRPGYDYWSDEFVAKRFLEAYNEEDRERSNILANAGWDFNANMTAENAKKKATLGEAFGKWIKKIKEIGRKFYANKDKFKDKSIVRQLQFLTSSCSLKDGSKKKELSKISIELAGDYSSATYCKSGKCYNLEPDTEDIFRTSRDLKELAWSWEETRRVTGLPLKDKYFEMIALMNEGARETGHHDVGECWRKAYDRKNLEQDVENIWEELKPLFVELHAFVRRKLNAFYKDQGLMIEDDEPIPAHLLGNIWAQQWHNIIDIVQPYSDVPLIDASKQLVAQNYTPSRLFHEAEKFYESIGLDPMTPAFWNKSIITRNPKVNMSCHGAAYDFHIKTDFRIMMCTGNTQYDFYVVHHEMGHIEYYMAYKDQPLLFASGANPGFHEAIGDSIALSVMSETHLRKLNLIEDEPEQADKIEVDGEPSFAEKQNINMLLRMSLEKLPLLGWAYIVDKWRWAVFRGDAGPEDSNRLWWKLRAEYMGLSPPVKRQADGFDPGCKYHVPNNVPYIRYFFADVLSFQFHERMCELSGFRGEINYCDIYGSKEAGHELKKMLELGDSKPWPEALRVFTGLDDYKPGALRNYFKPLYAWLRKENEGKAKGWDVDKAMQMVV